LADKVGDAISHRRLLHILSDIIVQVQVVLSGSEIYLSRAGVTQYKKLRTGHTAVNKVSGCSVRVEQACAGVEDHMQPWMRAQARDKGMSKVL